MQKKTKMKIYFYPFRCKWWEEKKILADFQINEEIMEQWKKKERRYSKKASIKLN